MTKTDEVVLGAVRRLHRSRKGETVPVAKIREWVLIERVSYDATYAALNRLMAAGLIVRVRRGHYAPAP